MRLSEVRAYGLSNFKIEKVRVNVDKIKVEYFKKHSAHKNRKFMEDFYFSNRSRYC